MKYIVICGNLKSEHEVSETKVEYPFIFANDIAHLDMYEAVVHTLPIDKPFCISAGFVNSLDIVVNCYGSSESLKVCSREEVDSRLISSYDYSHGLF